MCWRRSCRAQDTCVEREMRERDSRHQSGKKPYVLSEAEQAVMSKALMRSVTVVDSGHQVRNHEEAERADYRRALEDIIAKSDDPSAIAIAHAAITPWTPWVAVDEGRARAIQRAALPARYCPKCGAGGDKAGQAGSECWTPGCDGVIASRSYESVACTKQEGR